MSNHWVVHLKLLYYIYVNCNYKRKKNILKKIRRAESRRDHYAVLMALNFLKWKLYCQLYLFPIATRIQCNMLTYFVRNLIDKSWSSWLKWSCWTNRPRLILHSSTPVFPPRINHSSYRKLFCEVKILFPLSIQVLWLCNVSTWSSCTFSFLCGLPRWCGAAESHLPTGPPSSSLIFESGGFNSTAKDTSVFYLTSISASASSILEAEIDWHSPKLMVPPCPCSPTWHHPLFLSCPKYLPCRLQAPAPDMNRAAL